MNILVVGELNADLILRNCSAFPSLGREVIAEDATLTLGSSSAICAAGLAMLGNRVRFAGKVGDDRWAAFCIDCLQTAGVDTAFVMRDASTQTGITVSLTSAGDRALVTYPGAMALLRADQIGNEALAGCSHLHVSSFYLQPALRHGLKHLLARARAHGLTTSLDPGYDPREQWEDGLRDCLSEVDIFLPNEIELAAISGDPDTEGALRALANGRTLTIAKLGVLGSAALQNGELLKVPAFSIDPVDTTGAGDNFNAGFLHSWLRGAPLHDALVFAAACGALSTLSAGGIGAQPTEAQAREYLQHSSRNAVH